MGAATDTYNKAKKHLARGAGRVLGAVPRAGRRGQKNGSFDEEIVPVEVPQRRGDPIVVTEDEGVRPGTTAESLAKLRPAFAADGTVTAGLGVADLRRRRARWW